MLPKIISIHTLREEGDPAPRPTMAKSVLFLSTPSARRATVWLAAYRSKKPISIHTLREEGDCPRRDEAGEEGFLSTPSARRATLRARTRARDQLISIHTLREEGDREQHCRAFGRDISIHTLREEGDRHNMFWHPYRYQFLSTPSARRATCQ